MFILHKLHVKVTESGTQAHVVVMIALLGSQYLVIKVALVAEACNAVFKTAVTESKTVY